MVEQRRLRLLEVRVHGIGRHGLLSALGTPSLEVVREGGEFVRTTEPDRLRGDEKAYIAGAPILPAHPLRLVNWSRTTRSSTGVLWYLAFPFTLCNVAGAMAPERGAWKVIIRTATHTTATLLTILTVVWLSAMVETVLIHIPTRVGIDRIYIEVSTRPTVDRVAIVSCALAVALVMSGRQFWRRGRSKVKTPVVALHAVAALATGLALSLFGPVPRDSIEWIPLVKHEPGPIDMIPAFTTASTVIVVIFAAILWLGDMSGRERLPDRPALSADDATRVVDHSPTYSSNRVGCALTLLVSMGLFSSMAGLLRAALDGIAILIIGEVDSRAGYIPQNYREVELVGPSSNANYIPFFALISGIVFALTVLLVSYFRWHNARATAKTSNEDHDMDHHTRIMRLKAEFWHYTVCSLGDCLRASFPVTAVITITLWAVLYANRFDLMNGLIGRFLTLALYAISVLVALLIFARSPSFLAGIIAMVADVVGFFRVRHHPLAGDSYRHAVMSVIAKAVDEPRVRRIALVGHSQGSVLCAWFLSRTDAELHEEEYVDADLVRRLSRSPERFSLITCGSPLKSLYCSFFPRWFNDDLFKRVSAHAEWANYWRPTDPIATTVGMQALNVELADPGTADALGRQESMLMDLPPQRGVRGHSDYWIESAQYDYIAGLANPSRQ